MVTIRKRKPWKLKTTCVGTLEFDGCGTPLTVRLEDLFFVEKAGPRSICFECPVCEEHTAVTSKVPMELVGSVQTSEERDRGHEMDVSEAFGK